MEFFVRFFAGGRRTFVLVANADDTISSVHEKIESLTGIPLTEQCLVYQGKQLKPEQALYECGVRNDDFLNLVRCGTDLPMAWELANEIVSYANSLCENKLKEIKPMLTRYFGLVKQDYGNVWDYIQILSACCVPQALVKLLVSSDMTIRGIGRSAIRRGIANLSEASDFPETFRYQCFPLLLELCDWMRRDDREARTNPIYVLCTSCLRRSVNRSWESCMMPRDSGINFGLNDLVPFVIDLATDLSNNLEKSAATCVYSAPDISRLARDFSGFLVPLKDVITSPIKPPLDEKELPLDEKELRKLFGCNVEVVIVLYRIFIDLLSKLDKFLSSIRSINFTNANTYEYVHIINELGDISKLYDGCEHLFWETIRSRKKTVCFLLVKHAQYKGEYEGKYAFGEHKWMFEFKAAVDFETRRDLAMKRLPDLKNGHFEEMFRLRIKRSDLLPSSFERVMSADPKLLRNGLLVEFENEEANGFGVHREWFLLVCQTLFKPEYGLFVSCPNDPRRFFPSAASKVNPMHLEYFSFSGRVIAMALMCKIQVGILLDRVFFVQLAGNDITLEDIQEADPYLYRSCKQILEMDDETIDQDVLGLTFVHETDEYGERKSTELCPGGSNVVVNSKNRKVYVDSLIRYIFVTSISEQVASFAQGFADIVRSQDLRKSFFQSLFLEDFDRILHGRESGISVDDWKTHTDYCGLSHRQVSWFWKIVRSMSGEQKKLLLFFWTSVKYLPFEGFRGLKTRLCIQKLSVSKNHLPSANTCLYQLRIPAYDSFSTMRDRLHIITQGHIGFSFGTE